MKCKCGRSVPIPVAVKVLSGVLKKAVCGGCGFGVTQSYLNKSKDDLAGWFEAWDTANPEVYQAFKEMATEIRKQGHKHYGAKTIMERLRWESPVRYKGREFKLSNDVKDRCSARYVRKIISEDRSFDSFFATRELTTVGQRSRLSQAHREQIVP